MMTDVTLWGAFFAGLISFLSPCVLPLVPPYIAYLTGLTLEEMTAEKDENPKGTSLGVFSSGVFFVLGFSTAFVALGATASWLGSFLIDYRQPIEKIAGIAIIAFGLHFLGIFRFDFLNREYRYHLKARLPGMFGAYIVGFAFAFGWLPCVGAVLTPILIIAGSKDTVVQGAQLLFAYSMGIGIPFLFAAGFISYFLQFFKKFRGYLGWVEKAMGVILILTGYAIFDGSLQIASAWLAEMFPALNSFV